MTGQALTWGLVLAGVATAALVAVYNLGQVALARTRLTHAADAAAYSGAVVQARSLNMLAHVQRTQIAHQVAIAHLVTLGAWAKFAETQSQRYLRGNPPGYIIGRFFGMQHRGAYAASRRMPDGVRSALGNALDGHQRVSHEVLDTVARQLVQGLPTTRDAAIRQVLHANLEGLSVSAVEGDVVYRIVDDTWPALLTPFARGGGKDGARLRGAVQRAVHAYGFLGKRNRSAYNPWPTQPYCPWLRHTLRRRGETRMDERGRWVAVDTQSFHALRGNRYIGCYFREYTMGWSMVRPSARPTPFDPPQGVPDNFSEEHFWKWARRVARWNLLIPDNRVGNFRGARDAWTWRQQGLPRGIHVAAGRGQAAFALYLHQAGGSLTTTEGRSAIRLLAGRFAQPILGTGGSVHASAAAESYFDPAPGRRTAATAWRPYWHARLVPMPQRAVLPGRWRRRRRSRGPGKPASHARRRFLRHPRMGGQALVEACLALILLGILLAAVLRVGDTLADTQRDDHDSRLHAFAVDPALGEVARTDVMRREPGGSSAAAQEMRRAWRYADRGAVMARVGVRTSAVFREEGARLNDRAVQRALAHSHAAWGVAASPSIRLGKRIDAQTRPVDRAWGRETVSFDWLSRWSHVDVRRRRMAARRSGTAQGCPWSVLLGPLGGPGGEMARASALQRAQQLADRLDDLGNLGEGSAGSAKAILWAGLPLAHRTFGQRGTLETLVRLSQERLPMLRDLVVDETGIALTGKDASDPQAHWLLRWSPDLAGGMAEATLSLLDLGAPRLDSQPPEWLPDDSRTWRHDMRDGHASVVWCAAQGEQALHDQAAAELRRRAFHPLAMGETLLSSDMTHVWYRPGCRAAVRAMPVMDTPCAGRGVLWLMMQDEPT